MYAIYKDFSGLHKTEFVWVFLDWRKEDVYHCPSSPSLISWTTSPLLTDSSWGPAFSQSATTVYFPGAYRVQRSTKLSWWKIKWVRWQNISIIFRSTKAALSNNFLITLIWYILFIKVQAHQLLFYFILRVRVHGVLATGEPIILLWGIHWKRRLVPR